MYIKLRLCFYYRFMLIFCVLDLPFYNIHQGEDRHLYHMYLWSYTQVNTGSFSKDNVSSIENAKHMERTELDFRCPICSSFCLSQALK